jgi:hypothetical protein
VYTTVATAGKRADLISARLALGVLKSLLAGMGRLVFALDDTPTAPYGLPVQGAGVHHNPAPGPAGSPFEYGHIWVGLGLPVGHPLWCVISLPLLATLHVRRRNVVSIDPPHRPPFRTKLELTVEVMRSAITGLGFMGKRVWVVADGAYAKDPFLRPMRGLGVTVVSRLRKDAAPWGVPRPGMGRPVRLGSTGSIGSSWPSGPDNGGGGRSARSPSTGRRRRSGTRRLWRRGGRPGARSGSSWWTSQPGGVLLRRPVGGRGGNPRVRGRPVPHRDRVPGL